MFHSFRQLIKQFKELIPDRYAVQYKKAHATPFHIKGTSFSTVTINYNWRMDYIQIKVI